MTTQAQHDPHFWTQQRSEWLTRLEALMAELTGWAKGEGWTSVAGVRALMDRNLGQVNVPTLVIGAAGGEIEVVPAPMESAGGKGRVDIQAVPTLNRVRLIPVEGGGWMIMTDSNVPIRQAWGKHAFVELVKDLLA